jgi:rhamnulokinase
MTTVVAVDLGATSGRVIQGHVQHGVIHHEVVRRFPNGPRETVAGLQWDLTALFAHIREGLAEIGRTRDDVVSLGVDSWAVDYGLLERGSLLNEPFHYRDSRTATGVAAVHSRLPFDELFLKNGLQFLPFNTVYQLAAENWAGHAGQADQLLLVPDLINFWLTGRSFMELTNASTTGLIDIHTGALSAEIVRAAGAPLGLFAPLIKPGDHVGELSPSVAANLGLSPSVVAVGSHDTASAVLAAPLNSAESAYISCGTWGLVGLELGAPILSDAARAANFTNERGVDNQVRFLHNVMGLWLLNESVRHWRDEGDSRSVEDFVGQAENYDGVLSVFDVNDSSFMPPGGMPIRIAQWLSDHDQPVPVDPVGMVASIIESLAVAFAAAVNTAGELAGFSPRDISLVGGGSLNTLLCQRLADHAGVPVIAGPVESTALGNILVQVRTAGLIEGDLDSLRAVSRASSSLRTYRPRGKSGV